MRALRITAQENVVRVHGALLVGSLGANRDVELADAVGQDVLDVTGVANLATMQLAPAGTPLWHTQKDNFAPRLGIAWRPRTNLVIRAGAGIFYSAVANVTAAFPFGQQKLLLSTPAFPLSFPLNAANAAAPTFTTSPPVSFLTVVDPNRRSANILIASLNLGATEQI